MVSAKQVADLLTLSRLILALTLAWLGYTQGAAVLPLACWLMIASWTTDVMDGWLAHHSRRHAHHGHVIGYVAVDQRVSANDHIAAHPNFSGYGRVSANIHPVADYWRTAVFASP